MKDQYVILSVYMLFNNIHPTLRNMVLNKILSI